MTWMTFTLLLAAIGLLIKLALNQHNITYIKNHQHEVPETFKGKIELEEHKKAANYTMHKLRFGIISITFNFCLLLFYLPGGFLNKLNTISLEVSNNSIGAGVILFLLFTLASTIFSLPLDIYSTFYLEEKFGFNRTTKKLFILDILKSLLLGALIGSAVIAGLLYIMMKVENWWFLGWAALIGFQFILLWAYPRFISPLFNKFTPLHDDVLNSKIKKLLERTNIPFKDIFVMDASIRSSHGNAYFTGFGKNRRIVFFDTLLKTLSPTQVEAVLAHELGHLKHKHILKSLILSAMIGLVFFVIFFYAYQYTNFTQEHNIVVKNHAIFLLLATMVIPIYTYLFIPIGSWFSRKNEFEADSFAVKYSNGNELIEALLSLHRDNSSTLTPAPAYWKFYYSHPPALERFAHIQSLSRGSV